MPKLSNKTYRTVRLVITIVVLFVTKIQAKNIDETSLPSLDAPVVAANENFNGSWPFQAHYSRAAGFAMHYIDEGLGSETLLLLHGEPTWSYLYRKQIAHWSKRYRVIAVDHMGFGKSASPRNRSYWLQDHIDNLEKLVLELNLSDITLVMHDFGGPTGMGLAIRQPERIKRVISINAPLPAGQEELEARITANVKKSPWFQWIIKANQDDTLRGVLGQLDYNILSTLKLNGFENNQIITQTWIDAYRAPFPEPHEASGAVGWAEGFAKGKHQFAIPDDATAKQLARLPAFTIWGDKDKTLYADEFIPLFKAFFPYGQVQRLPSAGHYSLEDKPEKIAELVMRFIDES